MMEIHKKIQAILQEILDECRKGKYIFRGEKEWYLKISSSLYREYCGGREAEDAPANNFFPVLKLEETLVERARHHFRPNSSNIEILTELRHRGGKTALIDFTRNVYIALFFACDGSFHEDGRIILFDVSGIPERAEVDYNSQDKYAIVPPAGKNPRAIFQSSVFVHAAKGCLEEGMCVIKRIDKSLKQEILVYLKRYHNIGTETVYDDIQGFVEHQNNYTDAEAKFYLALESQEKEHFEEAIEYYDQAVSLKPEFAAAYNNRGVLKVKLGKREEALKDYDKAIESNPGIAEPYFNRGNQKADQREYEEALKDYDRALRLNPNYADVYYKRGVAQFLQGNIEQAMEDYDKVLELKSPSLEAAVYNERGVAKAALGDMKEAIEDFDLAIKLSPDAGTYYNRGTAEFRRNNMKEAIEDYDKAIGLNPQYFEAYLSRGVARAASDRFEEAIEDYDKAVGLNPDYYALVRGRKKIAEAQLVRKEKAPKDFDDMQD